MRRSIALILALLAAAAMLLVPAAPADEGTRFRNAVSSRYGMVVTESPAASRVGRAVLQRGGNAIDAAVATAFAVGVARPQSCGIGGGGFMLYREDGGGSIALDFRETAPRAIRSDQYADSGPHEDFIGYETVGVPGVVAGMASALRRYGTLRFAEAIAPAERLARRGVRVAPSVSAAMKEEGERLKQFTPSARQFLKNGSEPYAPGDRFVNKELAVTLRQLMRGGPSAFYRGTIARKIANAMRNERKPAGDQGLMTRADLAAYRPVWRKPLRGGYRENRVTAVPAPTSGGIATIQMLNILSGFDLRGRGQSSADSLHYLAEAQKIAWADRGRYVADPAFVRVPTGELLSTEYANDRRAEIDPGRAKTYTPGSFAGGTPRRAAAAQRPERSASTTHISVIDADHNAVALTCTNEQSFGSAAVVPGTGFVLNNELTDFGDAGTANEPAPGKRPRSSISPTIVSRSGKPVLVTGGAGGSRIIMGVLLSIVNTIDYGQDPAQALDAERIDAAAVREGVELEDDRVGAAVVAELRRRGHDIRPQGEYDDRPRLNAAGVVPRTNAILGASDSRTERAALGLSRPPQEPRR